MVHEGSGCGRWEFVWKSQELATDTKGREGSLYVYTYETGVCGGTDLSLSNIFYFWNHLFKFSSPLGKFSMKTKPFKKAYVGHSPYSPTSFLSSFKRWNSWVWWRKPVILTSDRLRQEDMKSQVSPLHSKNLSQETLNKPANNDNNKLQNKR